MIFFFDMLLFTIIRGPLTIIITVIEKVLSPGGTLRLLASSLPGLGRLLVDEEDLQLVRIRIMMMIKNLKMVKLDMPL